MISRFEISAATRKRKYVMYSSQDSGPVAPMTKKAKHISESEDDGSPKKQVVDFETSKQRTAILVQKFPAVPKHVINNTVSNLPFEFHQTISTLIFLIKLSLLKLKTPPWRVGVDSRRWNKTFFDRMSIDRHCLIFFFNTIFVSSHMYPQTPKGHK